MLLPRFLQIRSYNLPFIKVVLHTMDLLVCFMTFSSQYNYIMLSRNVHSMLNGTYAIFYNLVIFLISRNALHHIGNNCHWLFCA